MKIKVLVKPRSKTNSISKLDDGSLSIRLAAPPIEGRANEMLIKILAEYYDKPKGSISIRSGGGSRIKLIEIR